MESKFSKSKDIHGSIAVPIYSGAAFEFETAEEMEDAFLGKSGKHTYSRISNPTVESFEYQIKELSKANEVIAVSSGMAAISNTFMTIAYSGANIITSPHLFGNTFSLFLFTLKAFNVEVRFCNLLDIDEVSKHIDKNTCAIFTEIITNPHMEVVDLKALSDLAHENDVPFIVDSTMIPWSHFEASKFNIDIEVVSSTKYISGGGTSIGGIILDHQNFDWNKSDKLKELAKTSPKKAFSLKLKNEILRNMGSYMSPYTAYLQNLGLATLDLRYTKSSETCCCLADFLKSLSSVNNVNYTGLEDNPFYSISTTQFGNNPGSMLTFCLKDKAHCYAFMNRLKKIKRATNLFDNCSLIIHPLSTIYGPLKDEYKKIIDVPDNLLRLSVGLENLDELKEDILQAL